jgi:glycosyltransferase involved in cell wall biosynthesis
VDRVANLRDLSPRLQIVREDSADAPRQGYGAALRRGLASARHPLLAWVPADAQYQPADLKLLLDHIDRNHLVAGYRVWQRVPWPLRLLGFFWRLFTRIVFDYRLERSPGWLGWRSVGEFWLARLLFGLRMHDVGSGFILCRREVFERLPIQSDGDFAGLEILAKANFLACAMTEVPVTHRPTTRARASRTWWKEFRHVFLHPEFAPAPSFASRECQQPKA